MREAMFIKKNAEKWNEYQHTPPGGPDETAERFITLIDDLSYAKTFYPKSKVTRWINGIAGGIYQSIYQNKKEKYSRIFRFWKFELPLLFKKYHRIFLFTTLAFCLFVAIGIFSTVQDPDFLGGLIGENYLRQTQENIDKGDPFGVYKSDNPFSTFVWIAFNNIGVAFRSFIGGFTGGIYTLFIMCFNGIMLGSFEQTFFGRGLGGESVLVIWIHGTLEISAIVIASTAGFILASGILFPGTYKRMISFKRGARDAAKILIALIPIFLAAAFFETYVTHLMSQTFDKTKNFGLPPWAGILILVVSLAFIIWYFVLFPIRLHKKGFYIQSDGIINRLKEEHA
jgi:uncharacterized membrane protein SpoIIM required for sporulation